MFNKTYHVKARRVAIGKLIAEGLLKRDENDPHFYRPTMRPNPAAQRCNKPSGKLQGMQLELFPEAPLADLFPEAQGVKKCEF